MRKMTYTAIYERDDAEGVWLVEIDGIPNCHSFGRTLSQAQDHIRDALGLWLDVAPETLRITDEVRLPGPLSRQVETAATTRRVAETAQAAATDATREAATALTASGLSVRDVGTLLELSFQRVQQLVKDSGRLISNRRQDFVIRTPDGRTVVFEVKLRPGDRSIHSHPHSPSRGKGRGQRARSSTR